VILWVLGILLILIVGISCLIAEREKKEEISTEELARKVDEFLRNSPKIKEEVEDEEDEESDEDSEQSFPFSF